MKETLSRIQRVAALFSPALLFFSLAQPSPLSAQFTSQFLSNDSYWNDGKAEFDFYDAEVIRNGQSRKCEMLLICSPEWINPKTLARVANSRGVDRQRAIRMHHIWCAPIGMFVEQESTEAYWQPDTGSLIRLSFVGSDSFGNSFRQFAMHGGFLKYTAQTYHEEPTDIVASPPAGAIFYDELPLRVRTIAGPKPEGRFEIQLGPALASATLSKIEFIPAQISWRTQNKEVEITAKRAGDTDRFIVDRDFPFLLREWQMANGSRLKLKRSLKADYWNYGREGDRERALKNPMLQHPD